MLREMDFAGFRRLAREGNLVPVYREIIADLLTPVSAFLRIGGLEQESFLLESVEGGERVARYSFLGVAPFLTVTVRRGTTTIRDNRTGAVRAETGPPIDILRSVLGRYRAARVPGLPRFTGGAVGYFAYDAVRWVEKIPETTDDDLGHADAVLNFFDSLVAFDHAQRRAIVIANARLDDSADDTALGTAWEDARRRVAELVDRLRTPVAPHRAEEARRADAAARGEMTGVDRAPGGPAPRGGESAVEAAPGIQSNLDRADFEGMVERALEYIRAGDIFQVVLSQRLKVAAPAAPFDVYRALRAINPSPYMFFLHSAGAAVIGSSPEPLVQLQDGRLEYRPIAGTAPRGANDEEDAANARAMLSDEKEKAEHVMLVDLGRNDLGRVAVPGSVKVIDLMVVEKYSHVMHMVSRLGALLKEGGDPLAALFACFPAGTVSGAPKVRAMEIIDELEPTRRGLYAGAVGYLDFAGNLDTCIALRTMVVKDGFAYIQAGAGIVADSRPDREYAETLHKAQALVNAVEMAARGLE